MKGRHLPSGLSSYTTATMGSKSFWSCICILKHPRMCRHGYWICVHKVLYIFLARKHFWSTYFKPTWTRWGLITKSDGSTQIRPHLHESRAIICAVYHVRERRFISTWFKHPIQARRAWFLVWPILHHFEPKAKQFFTGAQNQNGISLKMNLSTVQISNVNISWVVNQPSSVCRFKSQPY